MTVEFDTTRNEQSLSELVAEWQELEGFDMAQWDSELALLASEQSRLVNAGEWVSGPSDLLSIIGRGRREVYHSAMLAWFLDPGGRHRFGIDFLAALVRRCLPDDDFDADTLAACTSSTEVQGPSSRADIVVRGPGLRLVIEVKVDAVEGHRQCRRLYNDHATDDARFLFLTPHGRPPSSWKLDDTTWATERFRWVTTTLREVSASSRAQRAPAADHTVQCYLDTLEREFPA